MRNDPRRRISPALVISIIALFVALGGGAYAALGKNVIKSRNIAPGAVKTSDLARNAVKTRKINDGAVTRAKIAAGVIPASPKFAWAKVNLNKTLADQVGGVVLGSGGSASTYCFDLPFQVRFAVATTRGDDAGTGAIVQTEVPATNCPTSHDDVAVYGVSNTNSLAPQGFFIYFGG